MVWQSSVRTIRSFRSSNYLARLATKAGGLRRRPSPFRPPSEPVRRPPYPDMLARRPATTQANQCSGHAINGSETFSANNNDCPDTDSVHLLILETDEPHPDTKASHGSFGDILHDLFTEAGSKHQPALTVTTSTHYVVDDRPNGHHGHVPKPNEIPESTGAILITGSMYDAHGDDPWIQDLIGLLRQLWLTRPNILFSGVCFGHQVLARLLGSNVEPEPGGDWELAHTEMDLTPVGQKLFRTDNTKLSLHQMHQDQVTTVPSSATTDLLGDSARVHVWAGSDHTHIQGLYIRDRLFTSQGHLAFNEHMVKEQIEMRERSGGIKDASHAERGKEQAHLEHDGVVVALAILRFFHGDDHDVD